MKKRVSLLLIYIGVVTVLLVGCKKITFGSNGEILPTTPPSAGQDKKDPADNAAPGTNQQTPPENAGTTTPEPSTEDAQKPTESPSGEDAPTDNSSSTNVPTEAPDAELTVTETPSATPSPTPLPLTADEAKDLLLAKIGHAYSAEKTDSTELSGTEYFLFRVSDEERSYEPLLAVNAMTKEIFYFYSRDEIVELVDFPPDNVEGVGGEESSGEEDGFSSEDAVALLKGISTEKLGLPAALSEYTIMVDEWTTMVYGQECYCINAYAELENRKQLMGVYFVAVDGSAAFRSDMGDFVLIH